jgi:hypothetical protein
MHEHFKIGIKLTLGSKLLLKLMFLSGLLLDLLPTAIILVVYIVVT